MPDFPLIFKSLDIGKYLVNTSAEFHVIPLVNKRLGMKETDLAVLLTCALIVTGCFCARPCEAPSHGSLHASPCNPYDGGLLSEPRRGRSWSQAASLRAMLPTWSILFHPFGGRHLETPSTEGKTEAHIQYVSEVWLQFLLLLPVKPSDSVLKFGAGDP